MDHGAAIEAALGRDEKKYGKVYRGEQEDTRTAHELAVMLEEKQWPTTPRQKERSIKKMMGFAKRMGLSSSTTDEIGRRAGRWIIAR